MWAGLGAAQVYNLVIRAEKSHTLPASTNNNACSGGYFFILFCNSQVFYSLLHQVWNLKIIMCKEWLTQKRKPSYERKIISSEKFARFLSEAPPIPPSETSCKIAMIMIIVLQLEAASQQWIVRLYFCELVKVAAALVKLPAL